MPDGYCALRELVAVEKMARCVERSLERAKAAADTTQTPSAGNTKSVIRPA